MAVVTVLKAQLVTVTSATRNVAAAKQAGRDHLVVRMCSRGGREGKDKEGRAKGGEDTKGDGGAGSSPGYQGGSFVSPSSFPSSLPSAVTAKVGEKGIGQRKERT